MTTRELVRAAAIMLKDAGCESPRLDADLLLMHAWQIDRTTLVVRMLDEVPKPVVSSFWEFIAKRQQREPVAYITGIKEFWSLPFRVDSRVLIPRPETEHIVEKCLAIFTDRTRPWRFCDIGTGSGCIACALATEFPEARIVASDISEGALEVAYYNARKLKVADRIDFRLGDTFETLDPDEEKFDAIVSNPPYVALHEMETLEQELAYEPRIALTDGDDGKQILGQLLEQSRDWLNPGGFLIVETGTCGLPETPPHFERLDHYRDLAGIERGGIYRLSTAEHG